VVKEFAGFFMQVFSYYQLRRFKQYLTDLITGRKPTVRSIASRLVDLVDHSSLNRFLILYRWDEEELNRKRLEMLQSMEEMRWRGEGVVAMDDTFLPKTVRKIPGASKFFDHN
jgi:SRSO17 transposase